MPNADYVLVLVDIDPDDQEATGTVHPFCSEECRDQFSFAGEGPWVISDEDVIEHFGFVPKCEQCGRFVDGSTQIDRSESDA